MLSAASQVGSASHRVLYTIGEEEVVEKGRQDILLGLAKAVANATAALVLKAKNVASKCPDQMTQNRVSLFFPHLFPGTSLGRRWVCSIGVDLLPVGLSRYLRCMLFDILSSSAMQ